MKVECLGWARVGFSGLHFDLGHKAEPCGPNATYWTHAIVVGWWVYRFRTWKITTPQSQED